MAALSPRSGVPPPPRDDGSDRDPATLTAKPHAFGGSVLTPKHAGELTPSLVLAATAALSEQANAPQPPPPPRRGRAVSGDSARSGGGPGGVASPSNSNFRHIHSVGSTDTAGSGHTFGSLPSADPSAAGAGRGGASGGGGGDGKVQYTVWITEAWRILGWAEPSAALFWEMATMYHTLHVAARSVEAAAAAAAQSQPSGARRGGERDGGDKKEGEEGTEDMIIPPILSCGSTSSMGSDKQRAIRPPSPTHGPSTPTAGSSAHATGISKALSKSGVKGQSASAKELPVWLVGTYLLLHCEERTYLRNISGEDDTRFAGSEVGGDGGGAHGANVLQGVGAGVGKGGKMDFSALLQHSSLSPRTRIHAGLSADNSHCTAYLLRHLRKFLLLCAIPHNQEAVWAVQAIADSDKPRDDEYAARSVSRNPTAAGGASTVTGTRGGAGAVGVGGEAGSGDSSGGGALGPFLSQPTPRPDVEQLRTKHEEDHGSAGLDVRLTAAELARLNLVLQPPSGGLIEDPPMRVGDYLVSLIGGQGQQQGQAGLASITVADAERELRKLLEKDLEEGGPDDASGSEDEAATDAMAALSLHESKGVSGNVKGSSHRELMIRRQSEIKEQGYHKELSYTNLRGTTILIKPNSHPDNRNNSSPSSGGSGSASAFSGALPGRLHDLHVSECSDAHMYLLQPFEHATVAACTDCTIVVGAVAGLLHVVDCERVTITSAARRVLVSNCADVLHCVFTPSPPLLVGDNRACQFAPYNTHYDGLREDLLSTGLAAALVSADGSTPSSHGGGSDAGASPALQCASNKWKVPVELAKLEIPQVHMGTGGEGGTGGPPSPRPGGTGAGGASSPGADEKAVLSGKPGDDTLQTPVLLPSSEFHILFVPIESEAARMRRIQAETGAALEESQTQLSEVGDDSSAAGGSSTSGGKGRMDSQYCRILTDVLQMSPFRLPTDYERRALVKADRMRSIQQVMEKDLTPEQKVRLEEELNRGFRDWLVTSGNLRQVLDLVHMERKGGV